MISQFGRFTGAASVLVAIVVAGPEASAQGTSLTLRGGLSSSSDRLPYSVSNTVPETLYESKLGRGAFGEGHVTFATPMRGVSIQVGGSYLRVSGKADTGTPRDNNCHIQTFLGLFSDCQDIALVQNSTSKYSLDALARWRVFSSAASPILKFGATYMSLTDKSASQYLYTGGFENFVDRTNDVRGFGFKGGIEQTFQISRGFHLNGELLGSWVRAKRELKVTDLETLGGGFNQFVSAGRSEGGGVFAWEARLSLSHDVPVLTQGATLEYGIKYEKVHDVRFTQNTVGTGLQPIGGYGKDKEDFSAWSAFVGVRVPLSK